MKAKKEKRLDEIEWMMKMGVPGSEIERKFKLCHGGLPKHYLSLRREFLRKDDE